MHVFLREKGLRYPLKLFIMPHSLWWLAHTYHFFFEKNNCKIQWKRFKSLKHTKKSTCKWSECELKKSKTLIRFSCLIDFYRYFQLGAMESASFHTHKLCTIKFSVGHGDTFAVANHLFCAFFCHSNCYVYLVGFVSLLFFGEHTFQTWETRNSRVNLKEITQRQWQKRK